MKKQNDLVSLFDFMPEYARIDWMKNIFGLAARDKFLATKNNCFKVILPREELLYLKDDPVLVGKIWYRRKKRDGYTIDGNTPKFIRR